MAIMNKGGNSNGNNRGKAYGMMLILAFGAALLGVMFIHKLRERRIFNLLLQDKDRQLISLHFLLQKEKDHSKEMKRKIEEMKAKIYSLRNQNMETERRILELQSTIDSLKDERKILESELEERQNEIKMNRDTIIDQEKENPRVIALMPRLKQKEAEIEDLKRHLEDSLDESKQNNNSVNSAQGNGSENASITTTKDENIARSENKSENEEGISGKEQQEPREQQLKTPENLLGNEHAAVKRALENGQGNTKENLSAVEENSIKNVTDAITSRVEKSLQTGSTDTRNKLGGGEEHTAAGDEQLRLKNSQQDESQDQGTSKGGLKLEMIDNSTSSNSRVKGEHAKEKQWRKLARNRRLVSNRNHENNEDEGIRKRKYSSDHQKQQRDSSDGKANGIRSNTKKESSDEVRQYESRKNSGNNMKMQNNAGLLNGVMGERLEETEAADLDHETNRDAGEIYRELVSDFEENKEEYKEETEESEF